MIHFGVAMYFGGRAFPCRATADWPGRQFTPIESADFLATSSSSESRLGIILALSFGGPGACREEI